MGCYLNLIAEVLDFCRTHPGVSISKPFIAKAVAMGVDSVFLKAFIFEGVCHKLSSFSNAF
jgi:hypothetical protein